MWARRIAVRAQQTPSMFQSMHVYFKRSLAVLALTLASCWSSPAITTRYILGGTVRDENGNAIAGVKVHLQNSSVDGASDSTGHFALNSSVYMANAVLTFTAPGYTPRSVPLKLNSKFNDISITTTLRVVDKQVHITLPVAGAAAATVSVAKDDGAVVLSIPANSLVLPDGTLASGDANVALTYWHPRKSVQTAPGPLLTGDPNGTSTPHTLRTYGMAAIEVSQNGNLLQVATGTTLPLAFTLPVGMRDMIGDAHRALPDLYYLNHTTGLWDNQGSIASGALAWNPNTGIMTAQLPHLSEWNIDGFDSFTSTCFKGTVINKCTGKPLANADLSIWFMAWEELSVYPDRTDADGKWCHTHYTPDIIAADHPDNLTQIYVSGGDPTNVTNSSLCQPSPGGPIPKECVPCSTVGVASACCRYQMDYQVGTPDWFNNTDYFNTDHPQGTCLGYYGVSNADCRLTCDNIAHIVNLLPCHVCPGSTRPKLGDQCWGTIDINGSSVMTQLYDNNCIDYDAIWGGPIEVSDGTCKLGDPNNTAPGNAGAPACPSISQQGESCTSTTCCASGLICNDHLCVPLSDPQPLQ